MTIKITTKPVGAAIIVGVVWAFTLSTAHAESPLEGSWIVSSWTDLDGEAITDPQPGLFIFTSTNYSIMYVNTAEARAQYDADNEQTDADKVTAYDSLTANSGGYELDGNTFTTFAYVAKDTNYMGGFPENGTEYEFERDGENLIITTKTFPQEFKVVLENVEGKDGPWESEAGK